MHTIVSVRSVVKPPSATWLALEDMNVTLTLDDGTVVVTNLGLTGRAFPEIGDYWIPALRIPLVKRLST